MITDAQLRLSLAQAATTGTQVSTNTIDLGSTRDVGRGQPLRVVVQIDTAYVDGTSINFQLIESAAANLGSPTVLASSGVIAEASLTAGAKVLDIVLPTNTKRYLGLQTVTVGTHTAGAHSAHVVVDSDSVRQYDAETGL